MMDWQAWHDHYDDPESALSRRLRIVQGHVADWLDKTAPDPVTVVSVCAGDGRDLLEVLAGRDDSSRVRATLLELDQRSVERARRAVRLSHLRGVSVQCVDAGASDSYEGSAPADLVLLCGVFGNIDDDAVRRLIEVLPQLCRPAAAVIWTRHRRDPDLTGSIRGWLKSAGFEEVSFTAPGDVLFSVGRNQFAGTPRELAKGERWFEFRR